MQPSLYFLRDSAPAGLTEFAFDGFHHPRGDEPQGRGRKELLVISQDTAAYGVDKRYKLDFACGRPVHTKLIDLCRELGRLDLWTRLHYVYPYPHVDDIVPLMAEGLILPYSMCLSSMPIRGF